MFWKTYDIFHGRLEYTLKPDGSWKAEFHGAIDVVVEAQSLERCRSKAQDALDEQLAELIIKSAKEGSKSRHSPST